MNDEELAIRTQHLTKRFGDFTAVDDLSLTVPQGSFFALLGWQVHEHAPTDLAALKPVPELRMIDAEDQCCKLVPLCQIL